MLVLQIVGTDMPSRLAHKKMKKIYFTVPRYSFCFLFLFWGCASVATFVLSVFESDKLFANESEFQFVVHSRTEWNKGSVRANR